jgi:membrane protein implicated in regulation of membrane protease activity
VVLPIWAQWLVFAGLAIVGLLVYRRRWKRKLLTTDRVMLPELEGEAGVAHEDIPAGGRGRVDLRGSGWDAQNEGLSRLAAGDRCVVVRVEGLTLHVRPEN